MQNIENYLRHLQLEGKSDNTLKTYRFHLMRFYKWYTTQVIALKDMQPNHILEFRETIQSEGKNARTINAILSCSRGYYDYLIIKDKATVNPFNNALNIQVKTKMIDPLADEQIKQLSSHVANWKENIKAAFHLMIGTGARVGEAAALKKGDFQLIDGQVWVNITDAKWGSDRKIPIILKESAIIVWKYVETLDLYDAPAFRVTKRTLQTYAENFTKQTGIDFHCHVLRHTFATRLLESGINIEKIRFLLGHKTYNMTRHYTQAANINVKELAPTIWQAGDNQNESNNFTRTIS